ncbi:MAG: cation diffusion facilitator family transporter [Bdellovibrionota bacterium]
MPIQQRRRFKYAILSIVVSVVVLGLKAWAYFLTSSIALRSDAVESIVNVLGACFSLGALIFAARPADENHPYGHGKIEFFSATFEGALISLASVYILAESAMAIVRGPSMRELDLGLVVSSSAGILNGVLGLSLVRVGKSVRSKALETDGHHIVADFWTSVGIILGLLLVRATGWAYLDPIMGIVVALLLMRTGYKILKEASGALLDEEDPELMQEILKAINKWPIDAICGLHRLRAMRAGAFAHVDVHLIVPEYLDVLDAHDQVHRFSDAMLEETNIPGEWHTHFEPCRRRYCVECPVADCPIRQQPFKARRHLSMAEAIDPRENFPS